MNERFQTFFTRLRPHRVAVLTNASDPMWQQTCYSIIEFLSQLWGGYHSLIIPTDGKRIDLVFWKFLSAFDPDVVFFYNRSLLDVKRWAPEEAEKRIETEIQKLRTNNPGTELDETQLRSGILEWPADEFSISPELTLQLLDRLSPFHFQGQYNVMPIRTGGAPGYPLTKIADIVPVVPSPDALFVLNDNLPAERKAPPPLWLHAETGIASSQLQTDLGEAGVTAVAKFMNTETESDIIGWGIHPETNIGPNTPFGFSKLALATVRSTLARPFAIPSVIVRGDTLKDFCLYYAISRNNGRAIWLPEWFVPSEGEYPGRLIPAVRKIEKIGRSLHCDYFSLVSMSLGPSDLRDFNALIRKHISTLSISVDDGNAPYYLERMLYYPTKVYVKKNVDRITTHQVVDEKLPGYFESPVPMIFSEIRASKHRWIVEIAYADNPVPRHPILGRALATGHNIYEARVGIDGLAYQCPGVLVSGDDIEFQMLRVSVVVPSSDTIFRLVLKHCGYESAVSDKGAYASGATRKFGGLENIASILRDPKRNSLLNKFMDRSKNQEGIHDQGALLTDKRRYLDFTPMGNIIGDEEHTIDLIDDWIAREILHRGFIFKCTRCLNTAWYSVEGVTHRFTCPRCGAEQQYRHSHWLHSKEPPWHYKLDEIVYQFLHHNGRVGILTVDALRVQSPRSFAYSPELKIHPEADPANPIEIDICCIMDNRMIIGEAKSNGSLKDHDQKPTQVVAKYEKLAKEMGATGIIFSTTELGWDEPSQQAIDNLRKHNPLLQVYNYRSRDLLTGLRQQPGP